MARSISSKTFSVPGVGLSRQPTETEPENWYRVRGGSGGLGPPG
jgi:hypothetical protein